MSAHFKLLGVHYFSTKARRRPIEPAVVVKVQARLRRLRMATHKYWCKRRLVRSLVLSLFSHTGAWTSIPKKILQKWRYAVETTMLGYPQSGRSRYLIWTSFLTLELDPEYALDSKVIFHELWRLRNLLVWQALRVCNLLLPNHVNAAAACMKFCKNGVGNVLARAVFKLQ